MSLLYVFGLFVVALFNSHFHVQAHEPVFECYSWGDPHIQTWHPKDGGEIRNRDWYTEGHHSLVNNKYVDYQVRVDNKLAIELIIIFHDGKTKEPMCRIHMKDYGKVLHGHECEKHGISVTTTVNGAHCTHNVHYPKANFLTTVRENGHCPGSCYYNVYVWLPQSLVHESTGICSQPDNGCGPRTVKTGELEWQSVRSGSARQFMTSEQAEGICNEYVDAFFTKTRRAPYQRDANLNSTIASVLGGCVADLVLTGDIEMAEGSLDVLMMEELIRDANSIDSIQTVVQSGIEAASVVLDDAVKMAAVRIRLTR